VAHGSDNSHRASSSTSSSTSSPRLLHCMPACSEDAQSDSVGGEHTAVPLLIVHAGEQLKHSAVIPAAGAYREKIHAGSHIIRVCRSQQPQESVCLYQHPGI
jgi:hypothetical protein